VGALRALNKAIVMPALQRFRADRACQLAKVS
jgi:hypothetical protein